MCPLRRIARDPVRADLDLLIAEAFRARPTRCTRLAEGAYGVVDLVRVPTVRQPVIVKWQKRPGRGALERRQLEELRKHAAVPVPEVLGYRAESEELPFEALVLEYLPGVPASSQALPAEPVRSRFAEDAAAALLAWHSVRHADGYGSLDGPYHARWLDHYGRRIARHFKEITRAGAEGAGIARSVLDVAAGSLEHAEAILGGLSDDAVLVHSDFWLRNILVDPATFRITGVIDPLDAEWADRGLDLIHLSLSWGGQAGLLESYSKHVDLGEAFPLRSAFYQFWYAMQTYARIGWHDPESDTRLAAQLARAMADCL